MSGDMVMGDGLRVEKSVGCVKERRKYEETKMTFEDKLLHIRTSLETEFSNECVKVSYMFDPMTRFLSIGVDHPLWPNFLVQGAVLPKENYDNDLKEIYDIIKHDLLAINKYVGETYE